jgi:hypothetical protein
MAIFNNYVSLPEGILHIFYMRGQRFYNVINTTPISWDVGSPLGHRGAVLPPFFAPEMIIRSSSRVTKAPGC